MQLLDIQRRLTATFSGAHKSSFSALVNGSGVTCSMFAKVLLAQSEAEGREYAGNVPVWRAATPLQSTRVF